MAVLDKKKQIRDRVEELRELMAKKKVDVYLVPTDDFHGSEYVNDYFQARTFITGFTGSAGTAVITRKEACLWTDGRYFIQAANELEGTGIILQRMQEEGVPTVKEYIAEYLEKGFCLGFDGRVVNAKDGLAYEKLAEEKGAVLKTDEDLIGQIWKQRPPFPMHPAWILDEKYAGKSAVEKLADVRKKMEEEGADLHLLSELCDIAWLLNLRGDDIAHVPVVISFLLMGKDWCNWYVEESILSEKVRAYLGETGVQVRPYEAIYEDLRNVSPALKILLDEGGINYQLRRSILDDYQIVDRENPEQLMKAIKNPVELKNIRNAHIKDARAMIRFIRWVKENIGKIPMTELSASDYLAELRRQEEGFVDLSFDTIAGYKANAAMMHYEPTEESHAVLKPEGMLLVDSGGHYLEGSTDITRTIVLGPITDEEKRMYTAVCVGNLDLANTKFLYGCTSVSLDAICRRPLWNQGIDYKCGTGHGNGYLLCVHEGPNSFRYRQKTGTPCTFEEGMVTTDEPGVYIEGKFGIRIENELICNKDVKNEYGQFLSFENISYVPIDLEAIMPELMSQADKDNLNRFHKMVYDTMAPYLDEGDRLWLKENTREI